MLTFLSKNAKISLIEPLTIILEATYYDDEGNIENSGEWGVGGGRGLFLGWVIAPDPTLQSERQLALIIYNPDFATNFCNHL